MSSKCTPADYVACANDGLTTTEAARRLAVSRETVRTWGHKLHLNFARHPKRTITRRTCTPSGCPHFHACTARISTGQPLLCEADIHILDHPEKNLWSRHGGIQAITEHY